MIYKFLLLLFLLILSQLQANVFVIDKVSDYIHFSNKGDVRWFEFEFSNSLDIAFSPVRVEVYYPEEVRPLKDKYWRGKPALSPRQYTSIYDNENKIEFEFPQIEAFGKEKISVAFVSKVVGEFYFYLKIKIQQGEGIWIGHEEYKIEEESNILSPDNSPHIESTISNDNKVQDSEGKIEEDALIKENSEISNQVDYLVFKKYFNLLLISIVVNITLLIVLTVFIFKTVHFKSKGELKNDDVKEVKKDMSRESICMQITPHTEFNSEFEPDNTNKITYFSSNKCNYLIELIYDNDILKRRIELLTRSKPCKR